jgi:hypothetical protein
MMCRHQSSQASTCPVNMPIRSSIPGGVKSTNPVSAPGGATSIHRGDPGVPIGWSVRSSNPSWWTWKARVRS